MSQQNTPKSDRFLDSNASVSDTSATNPKQLLNAYVYDFLIKSKLPQTAKVFVNEADIPAVDKSNVKNGNNSKPSSPNMLQFHKDNNLPISKVSMDAPQGFLFEWWQVFWDVFQAKNNPNQKPGASALAMQYHQLQMMKQRQQQDLSALTGAQHPMMANFVQQQQQPGQMIQPQLGGTGTANPQQQRLMMQYMLKQQQQQQQQQQGQPPGPPGQGPQGPGQGQGPPGPGQQGPPGPGQPNMNPNMVQQQQMYMMQQSHPNGIQQQAQNQMNNLRQQAAQAQQQKSDGPGNVPGQSPGRMGPNSQQQRPYSQGATPYTNPRINKDGIPTPNSNGPGPGPGPGPGAGPANNKGNKNVNALQDYQMQLMLLEKQNKKRLDIARNSGTSDPGLLNSLSSGMFPPNQQQIQQALNNGMTTAMNPNIPASNGGMNGMNVPSVAPTPQGKSSTNPSPVIGNKSPGGATKKKKEPARRGRKPSVSNANGNGASTPTASTPGGRKKDIPTPLTPASETPDENGLTGASKRKRKNNDSPKRAGNAKVKKENFATNTIKEENEDKDDKDGVKIENNDNEELGTMAMVPPSVLASNFQDLGHTDQMFSMDVLDSNSQDNLFGANNGLEDIDFDFNSFLDANANDGINNFNWSGMDAIEGDS